MMNAYGDDGDEHALRALYEDSDGSDDEVSSGIERVRRQQAVSAKVRAAKEAKKRKREDDCLHNGRFWTNEDGVMHAGDREDHCDKEPDEYDEYPDSDDELLRVRDEDDEGDDDDEEEYEYDLYE